GCTGPSFDRATFCPAAKLPTLSTRAICVGCRNNVTAAAKGITTSIGILHAVEWCWAHGLSTLRSDGAKGILTPQHRPAGPFVGFAGIRHPLDPDLEPGALHCQNLARSKTS